MAEQVHYIGLDLAFHDKTVQYIEPTLSKVAVSGKFSDLNQKPDIPSIEVEEEQLIIT